MKLKQIGLIKLFIPSPFIVFLNFQILNNSDAVDFQYLLKVAYSRI